VHPTLLYFPGALLSQPELSSARLDGLLIEVGDGYMPPDLPEDAAARVAALEGVLIDGYAASGPTAAWIHGVGETPPSRHHLHRVAVRRQRVHPARGVVLHDTRLGTNDFTIVAGAPVTTPLRTLIDLSLAAGGDSDSARWVYRVAADRPDLVAPARSHIESRHRVPGKRAALALLRTL
jgi:hypothetical protein